LVRAFGTAIVPHNGLTHIFPSAHILAEADLGRIGLPRARAHCLRTLARAVSEDRIAFSGVVNVEEFLSRLRELPGIGDWTAQYIAMRALGEPDAFPSSDLGLFHATGIHQPRQLEQRSQVWRPWRAYAAMYLWQGVSHAEHVLHANRKPARTAVAGSGRSGIAAN
jgi:3-methyladenine DNA glycosylase/8-oxoguanine DNA glycosylase